MTERRGMPLAASTRTKSRRRTSSIESLVCTAMMVIPTAAMATTGSTRDRAQPAGSWPKGMKPVAGKIRMATANSSISTSPSQKLGIARPRTAPTMLATRVPPMINVSETVSREPRIEVTLWPVTSELPRLPCRAWLSQCQYCVHSGWSSPSCLVSADIWVALALPPRIAWAALPGTTEISTKVSMDSRRRAGSLLVLAEAADRDQPGHEHGHHRDQQRQIGRGGCGLAAGSQHEQDPPDHRYQPDDDEGLGDEAMRAQRQHDRMNDLHQDQHKQDAVHQKRHRQRDRPGRSIEEVDDPGNHQHASQNDQDDPDSDGDKVLRVFQDPDGPGHAGHAMKRCFRLRLAAWNRQQRRAVVVPRS